MINTNTIIKFIGVSLIFLGYWRLTDYIILDSIFTFSFSLTGFLFILYDWCNMHLENIKRLKKPLREVRIIRVIRDLLLMLCSFSILALPHLPINWSEKLLTKLNDSVVLLGLGIVVFLIGKKSDYELDTVFNLLGDLGVKIEDIDKAYKDKLEEKDMEIMKLNEKLNRNKESDC